MADTAEGASNRSNSDVVDEHNGVNFNRNIYAEIENPLDRFTPEALSLDISQFAQQYDLSEVIELELLQRAGQLARDRRAYGTIKGLSQEERDALQDERDRRFKQPLALYITVVVCSLGAAVQGWDQTGLNSANLVWPDAIGLDRESDNWILGLVNAAPYFSASILGCWLSDPLNARLGRRGTIFFAAMFCLISAIGSAITRNWQQLFVCRLLLGIGMGAKASTVPLLAAENAPASIRGSLVMGWQLWVSFGIFLGFSANLAIFKSSISWRLQLGSACIPAVPLLIGIYCCPESPRWYIKKGRYRDAYRSLERLRKTPLQAASDLYYIHSQIKMENYLRKSGDKVYRNNYINRLIQLFTVPRIRRATLASFTVMLAQQLCGINVLSFYSSTLFQEAFHSDTAALLASWGFGLINFVFALPSVRLIDKYGRRLLLLCTFPHMAWCMAAAAFSFYISDGNNTPAHNGCIALFIYLFAAFYSPGEGPVPFTYSAEAFPIHHREIGMSFSVATNLFWAGVLTLVFPHLKDDLGPTGALGLFAGFNIVALVMIFLWVPETAQRTLEELDYIFAVPTRHHMSYQVFTWLPFVFNRFVLRKDVRFVSLYKFRGSQGFRESGYSENLA